MPADAPLPMIADYREAYGKALRGERAVPGVPGALLNTRSGAAYDLAGGSAALLWARMSQRDRDLFRQIYADTASGDRLEAIVEREYNAMRVKATYGLGTAVLKRAAGGTGGTIYAGTRIEVLNSSGLPPSVYVAAADTAVGSATTAVPVPVRASRTGAGVAVSVANPTRLRLGDSVFDAFGVEALACADGTNEESPTDYVARARRERRERRVGYKPRIEKACRDAGAVQVVVLDAGVFGDAGDYGITHVYVGDAGHTSTQALIEDCTVALEKVRVAGADLQVLGMTVASLTLSSIVTLFADPGKFNLPELRQAAIAALVDEFNGRRDWWLFRPDALAGAIQSVSNAIQSATIATTPAAPAATFPAVLTRYLLVPTAVTLTFQGPS